MLVAPKLCSRADLARGIPATIRAGLLRRGDPALGAAARGPEAAVGAFNRHPFTSRDSMCDSSRWMNSTYGFSDCWVIEPSCGLALELCRLGTGEYQRETIDKLRPAHWTGGGFDETGRGERPCIKKSCE